MFRQSSERELKRQQTEKMGGTVGRQEGVNGERVSPSEEATSALAAMKTC